MSKVMREVVSEFEPDNLVYDGKHVLDTKSVLLRSGQGDLKRGTVLVRSSGDTGDGSYCILGTAAVADEILTADVVLCDDVSTGENSGSTIVATCYRSGHFSRGHLVVKDGYTLTAEDEAELRNAGIYLSQSY